MNPHRLTDSFAVAPQIAPEDMAWLRDEGFALVINNRPDGEEPGQPSGAEVQAAAETVGLAYAAIPVASGFSPAQIDAMAQALGGAGGPVLAFCRSGTRSTFLWALAEANRGAEPETIATAAASAGYDIAPVRAAVEQLAAATS